MLRHNRLGLIALFALVCICCLTMSPAAVVDPFPVVVDADQGAGWFGAGDLITITEVRGASRQLAPRNTSTVHGKYRLLSHPQALITAYFGAAGGKTTIVDFAQQANVSQGQGEFTVLLPAGQGQARISFIAADSSQQILGELCLVPQTFPFVAQFHGISVSLSGNDDIVISEIRAASSDSSPGILQIRG